MKDPRIQELAHNLVTYSANVQPGENVLIEINGEAVELTCAMIDEVYRAGGVPFVTLKQEQIKEALLLDCTQEQMEQMAKYEAARMADMDAYIGVRAGENSFAFADVPHEKMEIYNKYFQQPVHMEIRVPKTKWVILRYPNNSMAQLAKMPTHRFEDYYFSVCNLDYSKMSRAMDNLVELMNKTDRVEIKGSGVDLAFSIKGIPAVKCAGECNIPDGEVYTAPVRDSINGELTYNAPSLYQGTTFENIHFRFENGKIVKASAGSNTELLNKILDSDEGARYIGEFSLGVNPNVTSPICDILFDEKIRGSFHFTPGDCYEDAPNGNKSSIHWDLVKIQTAEMGGGEIYFDGRLIRKDGIFVVPELECLNPENLLDNK